jgi:soluble lytic murein transglycosylase
VRFQFKILAEVCWALLAVQFPAASRAAIEPTVPAALRELAARAAKRSAWPQLRAYAESQKAPEERALAYFALGYREYEAGDYREAAQDLQESATSRFFLADYATYYSASAALEADNPGEAAEALRDFASNFPASPLRLKALESLAQALLGSQKPQEVIQILTGERNVRQHPELSLLLAKAYEAAGDLPQAARAFQEVYFAFPAFPQAKEAGEALGRLHSALGADFPQPTEEIETARQELLFKASLFKEALQGYEELLASRPGSAHVGEWQLGRARCLLNLHRDAEAGELLSVSLATPALNAERLALLVEADVREENSSAALAALSQIQAIDSHSESYESALYSVASLFFRLSDWQNAGHQYQTLVDSFPQGRHAQDAGWRLAWCDYLNGAHVQAHQALLEYLAHYPDSPRTPAALYWLGRLEEEQGDASEARALYSLLRNRFAHSYYTVQASLRERKLPAGSPAEMPSPASPMRVVAQGIPPLASLPISSCSTSMPAELLQPAQALRALSLDGLADQYLRALLTAQPGQVQLRFYLSQLEAEQGNMSAGLFEAIKIVPDYSYYQFSELPREMWDLLFPQSYWRLVQRQARANRLDPYLVMGLIRQESAFNPRATSSADARGLMQILPTTASRSKRQSKIRSTGSRLYDASYNVRFGCSYLRSLLKEFGGKPELALAAYNAGDFRVKDWMKNHSFRDSSEFLEAIPIHATRAYVEAVLRDAAIYRQLLTGSAKFAMCGK